LADIGTRPLDKIITLVYNGANIDSSKGEKRMAIKNNLSRLLGERRIKQADLAKAANLSFQTVHDLYHDKSVAIQFETMSKISLALGVQISDWLLVVPDPPKEDEPVA